MNTTLKIGGRIKELRELKGLRQSDLAKDCHVSQATVARWEKDIDMPPGQALMAMGRLAGEPDRWFWWKLAGLGPGDLEQIILSYPAPKRQSVVSVPLLKDSAAAGTGRFIEEKDIEDVLLLPSSWVPHPAGTKCIKVSGNSMSPILEEGYVVAIDTTQRDPKRLYNEMVAARDPDGAVTIKWLRSTKEHLLLVAQHTSVDYNPQILTADSGWEIIGKVLWWIGKPPKKAKGRK